MPTVDITCPPGVAAGDELSVTVGDSTFNVVLPDGVFEGDVFAVEVLDEEDVPARADTPRLPVLAGIVAHLNAQRVAYGGEEVLESALLTVLDAIDFTDVDNSVVDALIDGNCAEFANFEHGEEMPLHWIQLHEHYVGLVEEHIGDVLASLECSAEDVFQYAQTYAGGDERVQRLIERLLASVDLPAFCVMMRERHEILQMFG